jgi:hypothetical protein
VSRDIKFYQLTAGILITNVAGFFLRYYKFDTYFILIGFRFHISLFLPFLLLLYKADLHFIKSFFVSPSYKRYSIIIIIVIIPLLIIYLSLYLSRNLEMGDPDYFYEFGLSSIVDYPVYLVWNLPQLFMLFLFLNSVKEKYQFIKITLLVILLFAFEFVPINEKPNYLSLAGLLLSSFIIALLVTNFRNIYLFAISVFSIFWFIILSFGNPSKELINILFAARYEAWEGFFEVSKKFTDYVIPAYLGIVLLTLFLLRFTISKNKPVQTKN